MSCPDWSRLADGDDFLRPGASARRRALEHAADCPECRRSALELDPSLVVAGLPVADPTPGEIEAIRDHVLALRRVREVERESRRRGAPARLAAVACLTVVILLFAKETGDRGGGERQPGEAAVSSRPAYLLSEDYRLYGSLPLVEALEPAEARVYQLGRDDFSLVWIVDESIEVAVRP